MAPYSSVRRLPVGVCSCRTVYWVLQSPSPPTAAANWCYADCPHLIILRTFFRSVQVLPACLSHGSESSQPKSCSGMCLMGKVNPDKCCNIASLTMSARVKHFSSTRQHALREERHFALVDDLAFPTLGSLVIVFRSGTQSDPCISSVTTSIMITTSNSPVKGSGIPNQLLGDRLHTMAMSGLSRVRTELFPLLVIPSLTPHPIQTNG